jgi:hypothetical protein
MPAKATGELDPEMQVFLQVAHDVRKTAEPAIEQAESFIKAANEVSDPKVKKELERRADVRMRTAKPKLAVAEHLEQYARKGGERA